jgi:hypothetical protein
MRGLVGPIFFLGVVGACSRGSGKAASVSSTPTTEAAAAAPSDSAAPSAAPLAALRASPAVFSAPIAASRSHQALVVAGLVAAEGVIRVMALTAGEPAWTVDALRTVAWAPDAELKILPAGEGVAIVWRGLLAGKTGSTLVVLGPHGEARGAPVAVGAGSCTTAEGVAWLDARGSGPVHVRARRWDEDPPRDVATLAHDRAPTLLCGDHDAFVLGEGDDDLTDTAFSPAEGGARPSLVAIRDRDFGDDDEREHEAFTVGDALDVVRVGGGGTLWQREIAQAQASSWHRLKHALSEDDDIVAVDGDAASTLVVFTREAADACAGGESGAVTVRALRVDRKTGEESPATLAPAECDGNPGAFWIGAAPGGPVVAWNRRRAHPPANVAPIDSLVYRVLGPEQPSTFESARSPRSSVRTREGRLEVDADALVDAGCDEMGCFAAALARGPDNDGGRPESIVALVYPQ